jgi:hypothetical protein
MKNQEFNQIIAPPMVMVWTLELIKHVNDKQTLSKYRSSQKDRRQGHVCPYRVY